MAKVGGGTPFWVVYVAEGDPQVIHVEDGAAGEGGETISSWRQGRGRGRHPPAGGFTAAQPP